MPTKVTDPAILAALNGGGQPAPQQAPTGFPGVIPGRPKQANPIEAERLRLAQEAAERADRKEQRDITKDAMGSESERTAGFLAGRAKDAALRLAQTAKRDPGAQNPTLGVEAVRGVFGDTAANYLTDPERQQIRAAQIDIIDAGLTLGTGAAYTKEQLEGYREIYFPKLGDSPDTIASKREALRSLLVNAQTKAGRAAPDIEAALAAMDALNAPVTQGEGKRWTEEDSIRAWGAALFDENGNPIGPDYSGGSYDKNGEYQGLVGSVTADGGAGPANDPNNLGPDGKPRVTGNDPGYAQFAGGLGNIVEGGVNNTIGLLATPINSTINAALGTNLETNLGASLRQAMGLPYLDETTDAVQQAVSGGINMAGLASRASRSVGGQVGNALAAYGSRPVTDAVTGGSAAFSGEIARQAGAGPVGQAAAIVAGGAAPNALMGIGRSAGRAPADLDRNVVAAGERVGVPVRQPDAIPSKRGDMANLETTQRGGPIIQQARRSDNALIEQRTADVADGGSPLEPYPLGQKVQGAGKRYIERTRTQAGRLYTRAEKLAGDARVVPTRAIAEVDRQLAELQGRGANNNAALISYLQGLKDDLMQAGSTNGGRAEKAVGLPMPSQLNKPRVPTSDEMGRFGRTETVPLAQARAGQMPQNMDWQGQQQGKFAEPLIDGYADKPVAVRLENGEYIVYDGNHRTTRALNSGEKSMEMHVIDARTFDPENQGRRAAPPPSASEMDALLAELGAGGVAPAQQGGFSIGEFQGLRSGARQKIKGDQALTATDADRRLGMVMREFTADASDQLPEAASSALDQADSFYAQRQEFIGNVLKQVMGTRNAPVPAERAAERLMAMTKGKGDYDRFAKMWAELDPDEQADTAATIAQGLGRKANGDFSPATLVSSLDPRRGLNPRTARLIFGEDGARALQDLRTLAAAKTDTANALNNSRTGNMVNRAAGGLKTLILSGLGFSAGGVGGAVAAPMAMGLLSNWGQERAARALLNPDFTKMLKQMPEATNPKAIDGYFKRMTVQAAKSPILAQDVRGFQDALRASVNDNAAVGQLAAEDPNTQE